MMVQGDSDVGHRRGLGKVVVEGKAVGATGDGDAFNFLTDCVTSARRAKAGSRARWEAWEKQRQSKTYQYL